MIDAQEEGSPMIVSITFRHGIVNKALHQHVKSECSELTNILPTTTRVQVCFSKQPNKNSYHDQVCCHISVHAANKQHFDIYASASNENTAFYIALNNIITEMYNVNNGKTRSKNEYSYNRCGEYL